MSVRVYARETTKENISLWLRVYIKGKTFRKKTGIVIKKDQWIDKEQSLCFALKGNPIGARYESAIEEAKKYAAEAELYFMMEGITPSEQEFWNVYDSLCNKEDVKSGGFVFFAKAYLPRRTTFIASSTTKIYLHRLGFIERYQKYLGRTIFFKDINNRFLEDMAAAMSTGVLGKVYSNNQIHNIISLVKMIFYAAKTEGVHNIDKELKVKISPVSPDSVYLTVDEINAMYKYIVEGPLDEKTKTQAVKFIFGCHTGLRISDFSEIKPENIGARYITYNTKKTGAKVIIPINSQVRDILSRFDIYAPANSMINFYIKDIARAVNIDEEVQIRKYIGGKMVLKTLPKWDLITSHTARRSFATNAYKAGIPSISIMKITGHKTEQAFMRYIRISNEENAELMASNPFFH